MPMPRNFPARFDAAARLLKPDQSISSCARAMVPAKSPESYTLPVGVVYGSALGLMRFFRRMASCVTPSSRATVSTARSIR